MIDNKKIPLLLEIENIYQKLKEEALILNYGYAFMDEVKVFEMVSLYKEAFDNYDKQKLLIMKPIDFFLLFFPQLLITFIFTKVRIQTFFVNAVLLHIAYNFVILMLSFLFDT